MENEALSESLRTLKDREFLAKARQQLEADHFGLDKIKRRLIEFLAVVRLRMLANDAEDQKAAKEQQAQVTERALVKVGGDLGKDSKQPVTTEAVPRPRRNRNAVKGPILL